MNLSTSILLNINAITESILQQNAECNATIRFTFCTTLLMISSYAHMNLSTSILLNINAITESILQQNAECNATIRFTFCTTFVMVSNNAQMLSRVLHNVKVMTACILPH